MTCPRCRAKMNHHAEKVMDIVRGEDVNLVSPVFGGVIEEFYTCPNCGASASRRA